MAALFLMAVWSANLNLPSLTELFSSPLFVGNHQTITNFHQPSAQQFDKHVFKERHR
jgi:hypothetical protein